MYAGLGFTPDALKWVASFYEAAQALLHSEHKVGLQKLRVEESVADGVNVGGQLVGFSRP